MPKTATNPWTWAALIDAEPRLTGVLAWADRTRFSWNAYETMKCLLAPLVGWGAEDPTLRSSEAWETAHRRVLATLEARKGGGGCRR